MTKFGAFLSDAGNHLYSQAELKELESIGSVASFDLDQGLRQTLQCFRIT